MQHRTHPSRTDQTTVPELPALQDGSTFLETGDSHGLESIQTRLIDHLLLHDGQTSWEDTGRHAITSSTRPATRRTTKLRTATDREP